MSACQRLDSNWRLRSVMIMVGTPKRAIQPLMKACATASGVMEVRGRTSGHRVNLSTHVRR